MTRTTCDATEGESRRAEASSRVQRDNANASSLMHLLPASVHRGRPSCVQGARDRTRTRSGENKKGAEEVEDDVLASVVSLLSPLWSHSPPSRRASGFVAVEFRGGRRDGVEDVVRGDGGREENGRSG